MAVLSDNDILAGLREGNVVISPFIREFLGNCSYDVTLGENYYRSSVTDPFYYNPWSESATMRYWGTFVSADEATSENAGTYGLRVGQKYILISSGETILCHTQEFIGGRYNITTMMKARSSLGRSGISVCKCAGYGDIGYINRWTMEITNMSAATIILPVGYRVAQIVFLSAGVPSHPYTGKYQKIANSRDSRATHLTSLKEIQSRWHPSMMLPRLYEEADNIPEVGFSSDEESENSSCPNSSSERSGDSERENERARERPKERQREKEPERPREREKEPREREKEPREREPREREREKEPERPREREKEPREREKEPREREPREREREKEPERKGEREKERHREKEPREREREKERPREKGDREREKERPREKEPERPKDRPKEPERNRERPREKERVPQKSTGEKKEPYWCNKCKKYHHLDNKAKGPGLVRDLHRSIDEPAHDRKPERPSSRPHSRDPNMPNGLLSVSPSESVVPRRSSPPTGVSFVPNGPTIINVPGDIKALREVERETPDSKSPASRHDHGDNREAREAREERSPAFHEEISMDLDELKKLLHETGALSSAQERHQ